MDDDDDDPVKSPSSTSDSVKDAQSDDLSSVDDVSSSCLTSMQSSLNKFVLAQDVIYTSRAYATMSVSVCLSVCLSVTEVHWCNIANLGFIFRSQFTAHCGRGACGREL